jgi:hypothetical protein
MSGGIGIDFAWLPRGLDRRGSCTSSDGRYETPDCDNHETASERFHSRQMAVARRDENAFSPFGNFQPIDGANVPPFGGSLQAVQRVDFAVYLHFSTVREKSRGHLGGGLIGVGTPCLMVNKAAANGGFAR